MTVESDIFDLLKGLVSNRVYPDAAPVSTTRPYITYHQIGGMPISYVENTVPDHKHGMFQVNVWTDTRASASSLALQIEAAFIGSSAFQARADSGIRAEHEPDMNLYGASQDFSIWSVR